MKRISFQYGLLLIAAVILRCVGLSSKSFGGDEYATVMMLQKDLWFILRGDFSVIGYFQPQGYYVLMMLWQYLFGSSDIALRSFSVSVSCVGLYFVYRLAKDFINEQKIAFIFMALLAFHPLAFMVAQLAMLYSLFFTLSVIHWYCFLRLEREGTLSNMALMILSSVLLLYTHYFGVLQVGMLGLFYLFRQPRRALLICLLIGLMFLPQASILYNHYQHVVTLDHPGSTAGVGYLLRLLRNGFGMALGESISPTNGLVGLYLLALSVITFIVFKHLKSLSQQTLFWEPLVYIAVILTAISYLQVSKPIYTVILLVPFCLILTIGLQNVKTQALRLFVFGGLISVQLIANYYWICGNKDQVHNAGYLIPYREIIEEYDRRVQRPEPILFYPPWVIQAYTRYSKKLERELIALDYTSYDRDLRDYLKENDTQAISFFSEYVTEKSRQSILEELQKKFTLMKKSEYLPNEHLAQYLRGQGRKKYSAFVVYQFSRKPSF